MLGIAELTCQDVIDLHILPAFKSKGAVHLDPAVLASYLAFVAQSGLVTATVFDGPPDSPKGKELLKKLQQCAVISTSRGNMSLGDSPKPALHFPAMLQNQKDHPISVSAYLVQNCTCS